MEKRDGGATPSLGEGGVAPSEDRDRPNVPPLLATFAGEVPVLLTPEEEEDTDGPPRSEPLAACGGASSGLGGGAGTDSKRPCSSRRRMLHVASDSEVDEERLSESLVWSFFCLVRRFWNQTFTCGIHKKVIKHIQ